MICCDEHEGVLKMYEFDNTPNVVITSTDKKDMLEEYLNEIHAAKLLPSLLDLPEFLLKRLNLYNQAQFLLIKHDTSKALLTEPSRYLSLSYQAAQLCGLK